uniref:Ig-like domain-containing protein n=1 Tax=Poecilia latipinna TaxID=48699 RepID=A0A3B3VEC1_9TELE
MDVFKQISKLSNLFFLSAEPISNVTLSAQRTDLVEFNDTAVFVCSVSTGTSLSYKWLARNSEISTGAGVLLSNGGANLSIAGLTRYDEGPYRCNVSNGLGYNVSSPIHLNVSYGPMKPTVMGPNVVKSGNTATFNCSAESVPLSLYQWYFNGSVVSNMSEYTTPSLTKDMSGYYICMALNTITGKNSTASIMLRVVDPIRNVQVEAQMNLAVEGHPYNLTCRVNETFDHIYWMRNGEKLNPDNRTTILMENMTMSFMSMQRNDTGNYTCLAANAVGNMASKPFMLLVNYGPDMPVIMGPRAVQTGDNATLRCHAKSVPPSLYQWHFNGSVVSNMSEYMTPPLTQDMSWKYTCMALNTITGKNSSASMMLAVVDPIQSVEIQAQMNSAMENYSYNLTCNVVGPADYIYWMKSGNLLLADNTTIFDMNNKTVMFLALNSSDSGQYQCVAVNALGNMTSADYTLHVIYGPKMPTISGPKAVKPGSSATLSCYAPSYPPSFYRWYFNDTLVSNMSKYMTPPVTEEKSLKYTCMAFNNITGKNSSASITITAIGKMMPVFNYFVYCFLFNVDNIYWMKNGEQIHQDNSTVFSMDNKTVNFMPVDRYDAGDYVCMAVNPVGNLTSSAYLLQVIFGPDEPIIHGPEFGEAGRNAVFNCSAASMPPSTYSWWFNDSLMANTSEFTAGPLSFNMSGTYTCVAHNHVTEKNSTTSKMLAVIEGIDSVMIQNNLTPISNENFTLTCRVVGPYDALYWMKDGMQLSLNASDPAPSLYITEDNILHFTQLTTQSNGAYQCVATNKAALHKSQQYKLLVHCKYHRKLSVFSFITFRKYGAVVSLNCTVDSYPECDFYWFLNNKSSLLKIGSVVSFSATRGQVGDYICVATNPVTNVTMTQTKSFAIESE